MPAANHLTRASNGTSAGPRLKSSQARPRRFFLAPFSPRSAAASARKPSAAAAPEPKSSGAWKSEGSTSPSRPFRSCTCANARANERVVKAEDRGRSSSSVSSSLKRADSSASTQSACQSASRSVTTSAGVSVTGRGLSFFANSSSSPVSRNVPYAEAKTPRAVIQRAFGDGVCVEEAA